MATNHSQNPPTFSVSGIGTLNVRVFDVSDVSSSSVRLPSGEYFFFFTVLTVSLLVNTDMADSAVMAIGPHKLMLPYIQRMFGRAGTPPRSKLLTLAGLGELEGRNVAGLLGW